MTETPEPDKTADAPKGTPPPAADAVPVDAVDAAQLDSAASSAASHVGSVLAQVKERGFITTGEIFAAFPDLEPDTDELRVLWDMFESRGIKVLDEIAEELQLEDQRRAGAQQGGGEAPRRRPEHRPSAASRPGGPASRRPSYDEPDEELQAVRSATRPTHTEAGGSFDPVRMYLKEIGKVPLLTAEQEVMLAKRIEAGLFADEKLNPPTEDEDGNAIALVEISETRRASLHAVQRDGELARRQLTEANLRLVVSIAKRYVG